MEFSRIGEHTIKCVISEEEIYDLGYTMDEIMSNGERTQEFMNQIFDMAGRVWCRVIPYDCVLPLCESC